MKRAIRLLTLALLFGTRGALGAERATTIFWVVPSAATRCATGEDFATELVRRSKHVRLGRAEEAGLTFRVELFEEHAAARGRLTVQERDGHETVRIVPGADCREVMIALAVIAAVLVDPGVPSGNSPAVPGETLESRDSRSSTRTAPLKRPGWGFGVGAGALLQTGVAPSARPGAGVEAHIASEALRVVSPLFALGAYYTLAETVRVPSGTAELNWWAVRADPAQGPTAPQAARSAPNAVSIADEVRAIERARHALGDGRARDALAELQRYQARWPGGVFSAEALVLRVQAKIQLGERASAVREANALINAQPNSRHASRLRALLGIPTTK